MFKYSIKIVFVYFRVFTLCNILRAHMRLTLKETPCTIAPTMARCDQDICSPTRASGIGCWGCLVAAFRSPRMLILVVMYAHLGREMCVPRSGYMCTSVGVHAYLGRGTCVPRSGYDDHKASLTRQRGCADSMVGVAVYDPAHRSGVGDPIVIK